MVGHARGLGGGLHVGDVDLKFWLALVLDRSGADDRHDRQDGAASHRFFEILRVIFGKSRDLLLEQNEFLIGPGFESVEALADVREKSRLGILPVGHDLDTALDLLAHALGNLSRQDRIQFALVVWLSRVFCFQHIEQVVRPRQAADMRGLDVIGVLLNAHRRLLRIRCCRAIRR